MERKTTSTIQDYYLKLPCQHCKAENSMEVIGDLADFNHDFIQCNKCEFLVFFTGETMDAEGNEDKLTIPKCNHIYNPSPTSRVKKCIKCNLSIKEN